MVQRVQQLSFKITSLYFLTYAKTLEPQLKGLEVEEMESQWGNFSLRSTLPLNTAPRECTAYENTELRTLS